MLDPARADAPALMGPPPQAFPPFTPASATESPLATPEPAAELPSSADDLDREVVATFPYPVAKPYLDFLEEQDPRLRCKLLVDTFTSILKVWALIVASEYLRAPDVKDAQVHKTLVRDLARPLISAWSLLLQRALPVLNDAKITPFAPELARAYEALETKCKQRFAVTETYIDDAGIPQSRTKKLGKIQALIAYRNGLAHGFNQSPKQAQRDLDTYLPLLREVLRAARFLARYPLWHVGHGKRGTGSAQGHRLMGARPSSTLEPVDAIDLDPRISPLFLRNEATGEVLPLFAFFDVHEVEDGGLPGLGRDVFLFEGNTKTTVIYVSTTGEHAEKAARFAHWQALLVAKAVNVELLSSETLTLDALRAASRRIADQALDALVQSGKYLREASVDREDLKKHFDMFEAGKYGAFVLGGESGIGKSTLLARYVEKRRDAGDAVAFYRASALPSAEIGARLLRDIGLTGMYFEDFLAAAAPLFRESDGRFLLVIDGINEFGAEVAELVRQIDALVQQASGHDWFRVVGSVRDSAYQRLPVDARFGASGLGRYLTVEEDRGGEKERTPVVALRPIATEHVEALYEAYRSYRQKDPDDPESSGLHRFRPVTAFGDLTAAGSTRTLLRSPLMARLVLEAFHRRTLPADLRSDQAMRLYLEQVVVENGDFPKRRQFLTAMVREFDKASSDTMSRDTLMRAPSKDLRDALMNPQRDSAYVQLVELGVLLEEWDGDACNVRFAFDRLFEFLLGELHDPRVQTADEALSLAARAASFKSLRGALDAIFGRACEQGREAMLIELLDRSALYEDAAVRTLVQEIATTLMVRLSREKDSAFDRIIDEMPKSATAVDVEVLLSVATRLATLGEVAALDRMLGPLETEARALGDGPLLVKALIRAGNRATTTGDLASAVARYNEAREVAERSHDQSGLAMSLHNLGIIAKNRGDLVEAERLYRESLAIRQEIGDKSGISSSLNNLGILAKSRGDIVEAERLFRESLAIKQEIGDKSGISISLNNLGTIASSRGDLVEAERLYRESLAILQEIGDKSRISISLHNLGIIAKNRGDRVEAERLFRESLAIKQDLGDKSGISSSLNSLGRIANERGDLVEAERLYRESLAIKQDLGDKPGISISLNNLGILAENRGDLMEAERLYRRSLAIHQELGNKSRIAETLHLLIGAALRQPVVANDVASLCDALLALSDELGTPHLRLWAANTNLLVCVLKPDPSVLDDIRTAGGAVRKARAGVASIPDVSEGPALALWLAAQSLARAGAADDARALAEAALEEVGTRWWAHRAEAERWLAGESLSVR